MDLKDFKLYGLCIERLKHQIRLARDRERMPSDRKNIVLESYLTGDPEEIIDLLELYDIKDRSLAGVMEKLDELAADASLFVHETLAFDMDENGELCICLVTGAKKAGKDAERDPGHREMSRAR
jgi:hypothetical protein